MSTYMLHSGEYSTVFENIIFRDFPGGPAVGTPSFHCQGCGFYPLLGNWDPGYIYMCVYMCVYTHTYI